MHTFKTFSVLAIAATAFAAPAPLDGHALEARDPYWKGGNRWYYRPNPTAEVTVTGYGDDSSLPTAAPEPEETYVPVAAPTTEAPAAAVTTPATYGNYGGGNRGGWSSAAPAAAPSTAPVDTPSVGSGGDWFDIANKWRVAGGKPAFTLSSKLVANAQDTADNSVGGLTHKLNPGTNAQVLAPGDASNFESVYVGGWLCEIPNNPGLNGICSTASNGWNHEGQTGHAEILTGSYSSIGCALSSSTGVWACDLSG